MFELKEVIKATGARLIKKSACDLLNNVSTDSRTIKSKDIFFALKGNNFDGHDFVEDAIGKGAGALVVSKKIKNNIGKINILQVKDTTLALGDLARYHRKKNNVPLIAITGSSGKTTTKDIAAAILECQYTAPKNFGTHNNNIGVPQAIFKLNNEHDICVLELGTNHFGEIGYLSSIALPNVAVITNIGPSHLEFFKNLEGVFNEKKTIIDNLSNPQIVFLNGDDIFLRKIKLPRKFKVFYFGKTDGCDFMASEVLVAGNKVSFIFNKRHKFILNTIGKFNIHNALAGIGCGLLFGVNIKKIKEALYNFHFLEGRLKLINGHKFSILDDTYNSNPLSLSSAIESLVEFKTRGRKILVVGDMLELGSRSVELHKQIGRLIAQRPIDILVTLGKLSKFVADIAKFESRNNLNAFTFYSKTDVIDFLRNKIRAGDIVLIKGSRLLQMEDIVSSLIKIK